MSTRAAETAPHSALHSTTHAASNRAEELVREFILGAETGLRQVMDQVRRVAARRTTVLIRGETGTGKELIARAIHLLSGRDRHPFVVANCAAIPPELMESEMFGHVRGAFTGAISDHAGYFEAARRGTLILDEIGDLHPTLQGKILRILEDGKFRRVGGSDTLRSQARVIAATHQPLERLMEEGRFRSDLYYRVHSFVIEIPPLRERVDDIPLMTTAFLERFCAEAGESVPVLSDLALEVLRAHPWLGNVRELLHCAERLAIDCRHSIDAADVRAVLEHEETQLASRHIPSLRLVERQTIVRALRHFAGNRTRAAKALGIGRRTLQNKIKEYGL